jgi:Flp pilus assembly protein TadG
MSSRPWILSPNNHSPFGSVIARVRSHLVRIGALSRDRRGMSAVEFGLAAPVFMAMLTPVIDLGLAFSEQTRLNQAVEAGAQYASSNPYAGSTWASNVSSAMTNATTLSISPSVGGEVCGCPNSTNTSIVSHDTLSSCGPQHGTPPGTLCSDGSYPGYYVTISASLIYNSVMPYSILGNSTTLASQAVVRVQ